MPAEAAFRVRRVAWEDAGPVLRAIRTTVFVEEQNVPPDLERDGRDGECAHVLAESASGDPIGTGRLLPDGQIGRMAVLAPWRRSGVGGVILEALVHEAHRHGHREAFLHAQSHACAFYERHGFRIAGGEYFEAGIAHVNMRRRLA